MTIKRLLISILPASSISKLKPVYHFRYTLNKHFKTIDYERLKPRHIYNREIKYFDLLIYDTAFPNTISGFRFAEFNALLKAFDNVKVIVDPTDYPQPEAKEAHKRDIIILKKTHPISYRKTFAGSVHDIKNTKLFYCIFLNNMYKSLPYVEKNKINFVFTLYPGGGFDTKDEVALKKLKAVLSSEYFKGVIVTQQFTEDFIVKEYNCPKDKILNIFGCLVPQNSINTVRLRRFNKSMTLQVCFCAAKYTAIGADKGYDIFIETAKILASKGHNIHFNVVGGFDSKVISIEGFEEFFTFHGLQKFEELKPIFLEQDIILSPNRPFILSIGSFDGFPLGTVVEAALNGAVPVVTDELKQNIVFGEDEAIIVRPDAEEIAAKIERLIDNPELLNLISEKAQKRFGEIYCDAYQLDKRIDFIKKHLYDTRN
ncbi:glycosyltransferase family 4 protein [Chryseobacterium sp. JJR-5R]|uniref:glycosyltransferase family 4 protein n=1 Tax=Chryseobacterium sp. JJR-5R TaxID=3093923 RepID=UPI002A75EE70|nr:glycosyltransferase family 4 protein [Chryseobacterium sp. JJR-5R]WPO83081.1 glycosyltransferase family 4 protein [Chryseobacterium sp. JJR-5R]